MEVAKSKLVKLERPDCWLLEDLARHLGVTEVQIIRWALRYYALSGPWPLSEREAHNVLRGAGQVQDVGPDRRRMSGGKKNREAIEG